MEVGCGIGWQLHKPQVMRLQGTRESHSWRGPNKSFWPAVSPPEVHEGQRQKKTVAGVRWRIELLRQAPSGLYPHCCPPQFSRTEHAPAIDNCVPLRVRCLLIRTQPPSTRPVWMSVTRVS